MDGDGIGPIQFYNILFQLFHLSAIWQEVNDHGQTLIVDRLDITDISIKHFQIVVVTTMYNPISYPEKDKYLSILQSASEAITYNINTCTI